MSKSRQCALIARAAFPSIEIERGILAAVEVDVVDGRFTPDDQLSDLCRQADGVLTDYFEVRRPLIEQMERCRVICQYGVGLDHVDVDAATERGIVVTHTPDYCTDEVADHTLALLLSLWRKIIPLNASVRSGNWDYNFAAPLFRSSGRILGLVGFGRIARSLAAKAQAIGFTVLAFDPWIRPDVAQAHHVELCELRILLQRSDLVSLHAPLTAVTHRLFGEEQLRLMKPTAFLLNTSRGALIDQSALTRALREGWIAGAGLDVLEEEPPDPRDPLLQLPNVVVTPHAAFFSRESLVAVQTQAAEAVAAVLAGQLPTTLANPGVISRLRK
jgi:D-3-phosphoglycerate dehydrogenase / 2-oxoglutarate reductase